MYSVVRRHTLAGGALAAVGVLAATTIAPAPDVQVANPTARLVADSQVPGPIAAIANVPYHEIQALQALADALQENGPLACYPSCPPNNFLGWEPGFDEQFAEAVVATLLPFPLIAQPIADNLNAILLAELPVNPEGCAAIPAPCPNPAALFSTWFTVPLSQLIATGQVDPLAPIQGLIATLTTPSTIQLPDIQDVITTTVDLSAGLAVFLLPSPDFIASLFVPSTYVQTAITAVKIISAVATVTVSRLVPGEFSEPSFAPTSPTTIPALHRAPDRPWSSTQTRRTRSRVAPKIPLTNWLTPQIRWMPKTPVTTWLTSEPVAKPVPSTQPTDGRMFRAGWSKIPLRGPPVRQH